MHTLRFLFLIAAFPAPFRVASAAPGHFDLLDASVVGLNVAATAVQTDGKILIGGKFDSVPGVSRRNIARRNADGTLDMGFEPAAEGTVFCVALQADGKVLFGGGFTTIQHFGAGATTDRKRIARLNANATLDTGFDPSAKIRAPGVMAGGYRNGSSGLIKQVASFSFPTDADNDGLLDSWELSWWPTTDGQNAPDDSDHDGCNELLDLAFGLNSTISHPGGLPPVVNESGYLTMTLIEQPGVTYEVQSAGTLLPALPDSLSAASIAVCINDPTTLKVRDIFLIGTGAKRFMRVKVTAAP